MSSGGKLMLREREIKGVSGWLMLFLLLALVMLSLGMLIRSVQAEEPAIAVLWVIVLLAAGGSFFGLTVVNPNLAKVIQVAGTYKGSLKEQGLWWVNPISTRRRVSLRIRN